MSIYKEHIEDWDKDPKSEGEEKFPNGTWIDEWLDSDESLKYIKEYFEKREFRDDFPGTKTTEK